MPARFADRLDVDADGNTVQGSLLAAVPGCHLDLVLLLVVVTEFLCVPDVTWQREKVEVKLIQNSFLKHLAIVEEIQSTYCVS